MEEPRASLPESADVILSKNGAGILLRTLKRGDGVNFPRSGDMCLIHFDALLENGTKIASSRDKNQPLEFKLGDRHVLEGLEVACSNMSIGQNVEVTIPALYAYGQQGFPPKVPPRETIIFDLVLLDINASFKINMNGPTTAGAVS